MSEYVTPSPAEREVLQDEAVQLQARMRAAAQPIAARWAYWETLTSEAWVHGIEPGEMLSAETVDVHDRLDEDARTWAEAYQALDAGRATLVPYVLDDQEQTRWGIAEKGTVGDGLGVWPVVFQVLRVSATALAGAATWLLTDTYFETDRLRAESEQLEAQTDNQLSQLATDLQDTQPQAAAAIAQALSNAREAAETARADSSSWLDSLTGAAGTAAAGIGGLGVGALLALLFFSEGAK